MATGSARTRRNYNTPGTVDGNLARKLDRRELERQLDRSGQLDFDQQYRRRRETEAEKLSRKRSQVKASVRPAQSVSPAMVVGFAAVAVMLLGLLMGYVQLNALSRSIVSMKSEISALETEQVRLRTEYEQAFDLTSVKAAAEAAGMSAPSDSQIYFITLPGEDRAQVYAGASHDFFSTVQSSLEQIWDTVVEYFR